MSQTTDRFNITKIKFSSRVVPIANAIPLIGIQSVVAQTGVSWVNPSYKDSIHSSQSVEDRSEMLMYGFLLIDEKFAKQAISIGRKDPIQRLMASLLNALFLKPNYLK